MLNEQQISAYRERLEIIQEKVVHPLSRFYVKKLKNMFGKEDTVNIGDVGASLSLFVAEMNAFHVELLMKNKNMSPKEAANYLEDFMKGLYEMSKKIMDNIHNSEESVNAERRND